MEWSSQASQDKFVYYMLVKNNPGYIGTYLELGANVPIYTNNTYVFEKLGWYGLSIDIDSNCKAAFDQVRKNDYILADVTKLDWDETLKRYPGILRRDGTIDYISFDVDDATMAAFDNFPWDTIKFKVMTIEHDAYRVGPALRAHIRQKLISLGYDLVCSNVVCAGYGFFEDWFVAPEYFSKDAIEQIRCDHRLSSDIPLKLD